MQIALPIDSPGYGNSTFRRMRVLRVLTIPLLLIVSLPKHIHVPFVHVWHAFVHTVSVRVV